MPFSDVTDPKTRDGHGGFGQPSSDNDRDHKKKNKPVKNDNKARQEAIRREAIRRQNALNSRLTRERQERELRAAVSRAAQRREAERLAKEAEQRRLQAGLASVRKAYQEKLAREARAKAFASNELRMRAIINLNAERAKKQREIEQAKTQEELARKLKERRDIQNDLIARFGAPGMRDVNGVKTSLGIAEEARKKGHVNVLKDIRRQTRATGGRYVDTERFDAVVKDFNDRSSRNRAQLSLWGERIKKALADGDIDKARRLFNNSKFQAIREEFKQINGEGRKPGEAQELAKVWRDIARDNDSWRERFLTGMNLTPNEAQLKRDMAVVETLRTERDWVVDSSGNRPGHFVDRRLNDQELQDKLSRLQKQYMQAQEGFKAASSVISLLPGAYGWGLKPEPRPRSIFDIGEQVVSHPGFTYDENPLTVIKRGLANTGKDFESIKRDFEFGTTSKKNSALMKLFFAGQDEWMRSHPKPDYATEMGPKTAEEALQYALGQGLDPRSGIKDDIYSLIFNAENEPEIQAWQEMRKRYRDSLWKFLTGSDVAPSDTELDMARMLESPFVGDVVRLLGIPVGLVMAGARTIGNAVSGGGRISVPNVEVGNIVSGTGPWVTHPGEVIGPDIPVLNPLSTTGIRFDTGKEAKQTEQEDFKTMVGDIFLSVARGDVSGIFDAVANYGNNAIQGNLGFIYYTVADPLTYGPSIFKAFGAGRAAVSRAGGALRAIKDIDTTLTDFYKLIGPHGGVKAGMLPKAWRGYGDVGGLWEHDMVTKFNRVLGTKHATLSDFISSQDAKLVRDLLENKHNPVATRNILEKFYGHMPVNSEQLTTAVQQIAKEMAEKMGITVTSATDLEAMLVQAEKSLERAQREAASLAAESERVRSTEYLADAAELARNERRQKGGQNVPFRTGIRSNIGHRVDIEKMQKELDVKVAERLNRAQEAADAANVLKTVTGYDLRSIEMRREAVDKLRGALDEVERLDGAYGEITIDRMDIAGQSQMRGIRSVADHFNVQKVQVEEDLRYVRYQIRGIKKILNPNSSTFVKNRLRRLEMAEQYYHMELRRLRGADQVRGAFVAKYGEQAKQGISPQRIAVAVRDAGELAEETARALYKKIRSSAVDSAGPRALTIAEIDEINDMQSSIRGVMFDDHRNHVAGSLGGWTNGLDMQGALEFLHGLYRARPVLYGQIWAEAVDQFNAARAAAGHTAINVEDVMDKWARSHAETSMDIRTYRKLDREIRDASRRIRGKKAGVTSFRRPRQTAFNPDSARDLIDIEFARAKFDVLKSHGWSVKAYDEASDVLRFLELRRNTSMTLTKRAKSLAKASNGTFTFEEAFNKVRDKFLTEEAKRQLGHFFNRSYIEGMSEDDMFRLFEEVFLSDDLITSGGAKLTQYQYNTLVDAFSEVTGIKDLNDVKAIQKALTQASGVQKMTRPEFRAWLESTGRWAPRTADVIRTGKHVWSVQDEARFFEYSFGFVPEWADVNVIAKILHDPEDYKAFFEKHGYFDDGFEIQLASLKIEVDEQKRVMAFGDGQGIKRGRTQEELRSWAAQRYGTLVSDDGGKTLKALPQLMNPAKGEYVDWIRNQVMTGRVIDPTLIQPGQLVKFADAVQEAVARRIKRLEEDGYVEKGADWIPQEQLLFAMDVVDELKHSQEWRGLFRGKSMGKWGIDLFGHLMRINIMWNPAFGVMNMLDSFGVKPLLLLVANGGMKFARTPSKAARDAIPNLKAIAVERQSVWLMGEASGIDLAKNTYLRRSTRVKGLVKGLTVDMPAEVSSRAEDRLKLGFAQRLYDDLYPKFLAAIGDAEKARNMTFREVHDGVMKFFPSMDNAGTFEKMLNQLVPFFSYNLKNKVLGISIFVDHPWLINLVGNIGDTIQEANEEQWKKDHPGEPLPDSKFTRRLWLGVGDETLMVDLTEFSDWFRGPKTLADYEQNGVSVNKFMRDFVRIPHPQQAIMWAWFAGQAKSIDGVDATLDNWFFPADFASSLGEAMAADGDPVPWVQLLSKMLFFKEFKILDPVQPKIDLYFSLKAAGQDIIAAKYLKDHPELLGWFDAHTTEKYRVNWGDGPKAGFYSINKKNREVITEYELARRGLDELTLRWDQKLEQMFDTPWKPEYRQLKKDRRMAIQAYIVTHPIIMDARASYMSPSDWAKQMDDWQVDTEIDMYFDRIETSAPKRTDYKTELAYLQASVEFNKWKKSWLAAHPKVVERLATGFTEVETAWRAQESQWSAILDANSRYMIRILKEEAKPKPDSDLVNVLYDARELNYLILNAESYVDIAPGIRNRASVNESVEDADTPFSKRAASALSRFYSGGPKERDILPGLSDFTYDGSDDKTRAEIEYREWLHKKIHDVYSSGGPKGFYDRLGKDPRVLRAYLYEHPDKVDDVRYAREMSDLIRRSSSGSDFYHGLDVRPWLRRQYFARHPEAKVRYEIGKRYYRGIHRVWRIASRSEDFGVTWGKLLARDPWLARQYALRHPGSDSHRRGDSRYYTEITQLYRHAKNSGNFGEAWVEGLDRNPWLREQYFARNPGKEASYRANGIYSRHMGHWVSLLKAGDYSAASDYFDSMPAWVQERYNKNHPRSASFRDSSAYHGAMEKWVKMLQAGDMDGANKFFQKLPNSIKERYFSKHPDQRFKLGLTSEQMAKMSEYWLMPENDPDRITWLSRNPGLARWMQQYVDDEASRRLLVMQLYRNVSREDAWIRRRLADRYPEIFSQEAIGEHKLENVAEKLAANPELLKYYSDIVRYLSEGYQENLKHHGTLPKPVTFEYLNRWEVKNRRRRVAMSEHNRKHLRLSA